MLDLDLMNEHHLRLKKLAVGNITASALFTISQSVSMYSNLQIDWKMMFFFYTLMCDKVAQTNRVYETITVSTAPLNT